ncbi:NAD-dependent epimerase/dehydratase family protein [Tepidimonas taiwanensis]|uniref:NAD-dependent epimerase/dehydratase family protein n=1 Tax=Tepidimonas taiwanensis TaxID=307486 RepID=UPI0007340B81|nr:NAD-dependent epimerase/dehydratase family protein [Tepidimonas taiwanensis]
MTVTQVAKGVSVRCFITGTAGFIGFHLARLLLEEGHTVHGFDGLTDYYDVRLKHRRHAMLREYPAFTATEAMLEDAAALHAAAQAAQPDVIIHLAAQAGVRYSLQNPRAYIDANLVGTFNLLEVARALKPRHLLMASTSSVYGANTDMPFAETQKADTPLTLYAATKKANEAMAHAYAHIYGVPTTMFRFFTVYGPWGRPDMALFKFTQGILEGRPIEIYNHGEMYRDFTYVDDLVRAIRLLIDAVPPAPEQRTPERGWQPIEGDTLSPAAPWRVVNIGNSQPVRLLDFVEAIEAAVGKPAIRQYLPMQTGDVPATWADCTLLKRLTGYQPQTPVHEGVRAFVGWYRVYYC